MAKVKSAKQRITDYLKAKGYDVGEIQDAFAELDAADVDLDTLAAQVADTKSKNDQWVQWYNQIQPAIQEIVGERDTLKERISKLEAAGLSFGDAQEAARLSMQHQPQGQGNFDPTRFQDDLTRATNDVMKNVAKYGFKHFKEFNEELDYDEVEKIMTEKRIPFDVAYSQYTEPRREKKRSEEMQVKIQQGIQEGVQAALSKQGIRHTRKRVDDVEPAPLDKPAPPDEDLKAAFLRDLEAEVTH